VQQLLELEVLSEAKRLKSRYSSEQVEQLKQFSEKVNKAFGSLASEYAEADSYV
jgi:hypothetical protein